MSTRMLDAFITYECTRHEMPHGHNTNIIGISPGTRLYRIIRTDSGWRVWTATRDFVHGSYIELHNDGSAYRWECRPDEGDECIMIRPDDAEVHYRWTLANVHTRAERSDAPPADLADLADQLPTTDVDGLTHVHQQHINLNPDNDRLDEINQQQPDTE